MGPFNYKVKCLCFSALYTLRNVLIIKLVQLLTVNLYVFLSALYTLQSVPIIIDSCNCIFIQKKKKKKKERKRKIPKVMPQYPTIYLFSWEREGILMSQTLHKN